MANAVRKKELGSRSGNSRFYGSSPSEINRRLGVSYPEISDDEAIRIANGLSHESEKVDTFFGNKDVVDSEYSANDEALFKSHDLVEPILSEPTKKELNGENYRGVRMFRRGQRSRRNNR